MNAFKENSSKFTRAEISKNKLVNNEKENILIKRRNSIKNGEVSQKNMSRGQVSSKIKKARSQSIGEAIQRKPLADVNEKTDCQSPSTSTENKKQILNFIPPTKTDILNYASTECKGARKKEYSEKKVAKINHRYESHGTATKHLINRKPNALSDTISQQNFYESTIIINLPTEDEIKISDVLSSSEVTNKQTYKTSVYIPVGFTENKIFNLKGATTKISTIINKNKFSASLAKTSLLCANSPFIIDRKNITVRRRLTPNATPSSDCEDVFFESALHLNFQASEASIRNNSYDQPSQQFMVPMQQNVFIGSATVALRDLPEKPARKTTLAHKTKALVGPIYEDLHTCDYLEDIIKYALENDGKFVVKENFLKAHSSLNLRECIINWLHKIQNYYQLPIRVILITVRLFDVILATVKLPFNKYELVALSILWIINKYENNVVPLLAPKLLQFCGGICSVSRLVEMERKILKFFNFDCNIPEPTTYISYYMKKIDKLDDKLRHCVYYLLECYTLSPEYSVVKPSIQAAAAFYLSSKMHYSQINMWSLLRGSIAFYEFSDIETTCQSIITQINKILNDSRRYYAFHDKYARKYINDVSINFKL